MHAALQHDVGRLHRVCRPCRDHEPEHREGGEPRSGAAELAAVVSVRVVDERIDGVAEHLRQQPGAREERERRLERRRHAGGAGERHRERQLEPPDRHGGPAGLVGKQAVEDGHVERQAGRHHQAAECERPPLAQDRGQDHGEREGQYRGAQTRLEPASQRVGHVLRRKARAAAFMPTRVSAAG